MLDWIAATFDARIIFIVRHPGAVVASKIAASHKKGGSIWDFEGPNEQKVLSQYRHDEQFKKDYLGKYYDIFNEKLTLKPYDNIAELLYKSSRPHFGEMVE